MLFWFGLGLIGWIFLIRIRLLEDELPPFELWSYLREFIIAILLGPTTILYGCFLIWRWLND